MELLKKYNKESYLFLFLALLNALPLFVSSNFVTLDGGAHAYNTNVISELLFNKESVYHDYYQFNPEPVPNWFTHILLVVFKSIMPYFLAEKLVVFIYFILTPLFFRKTVLLINNNNKPLTYIIFPFVHFLMLYLGFFNFCYGILFSFIGFYYWTKNFNQMSAKKWALMFVILAATYFSHIFPFVVLVMYCLSSVFFNYVKEHGESFKNLVSRFFTAFIKPSLFLGILLLPMLYLLKYYFDQRPTYGKEIFLTHKDLAKLVFNIKPLQVYSDVELKYTMLISISVLALMFITAALTLWHYFKKIKSFRLDFLKHNFLFLSVVLLGLLFFVPDDDGFGGFISIRIILFIWYFLLFWIATQEVNKKVQWVFVIILLGLHAPLLKKRVNGVKWVCSEYKKLEGIDKLIEPNSTVVQIYNDDSNWLGHHFSNYLGTNKSIVVLDNYEASRGYFPLLWKDDYIPNLTIGGKNMFETCLYWKSNPYNPETKPVDYVLMIGQKPGDECYDKTIGLLGTNGAIIYSNEKINLYRIKK
jgi:hypothetical protein